MQPTEQRPPLPPIPPHPVPFTSWRHFFASNLCQLVIKPLVTKRGVAPLMELVDGTHSRINYPQVCEYAAQEQANETREYPPFTQEELEKLWEAFVFWENETGPTIATGHLSRKLFNLVNKDKY